MYLTHAELCAKYLLPYSGVSYLYDKDKGYIVWRRGTGDNVELLHIRTFEHRKGYAKELVKAMLNQLVYKPPYYSVFGFGILRGELDEIYMALGFRVIPIPGPTKSEGILFWQSFEKLRAKYEV